MVVRLIISIGICLAVGAIAGVFTSQSIPTWYASLAKPGFNPPNWLFGPVWTLLYILMGVSLYLVWQQARSMASLAIIVFIAQLALNFAWSFIFFKLQSPVGALVDIISLWLFIVVAIILFYPLSKTASWLLVPYLAWVSFATALNAAIVRLN